MVLIFICVHRGTCAGNTDNNMLQSYCYCTAAICYYYCCAAYNEHRVYHTDSEVYAPRSKHNRRLLVYHTQLANTRFDDLVDLIRAEVGFLVY